IYAARQVVGHGHIQVNGRKVDRPGFAVQPGDEVTVRQGSRQMGCFREWLESSLSPPEYLTMDKDTMVARLERLPVRDEVPVICDVAKVIEFYSR
ncbi:MAG: S4 domain-containing protein, partial [Acidobacteriota bacterium]